ncbi:MAG: peptidase M61, partial [Gammaproteobacteria bacterium]
MSNTKIHYRIIPSNPAAHIFTITCTVAAPDANGQILWLPAWIPGSYMIRDFARNIVTLRARDENGQVDVRKLDKQTWQCAPCTGTLEIEYQVYAFDLSVRSAHLDTTHGFFNGSSVFLAVQGQEDQAVEIDIQLPPQDFASQWRVATTLTCVYTQLFSPGKYSAANYEELIDHPVEMGNFVDITFQVNATPHHIIISGRQQADLELLARDVQQICQTQVAVFEELPVMERYMFLLQVVGDGYGGLEHR